MLSRLPKLFLESLFFRKECLLYFLKNELKDGKCRALVLQMVPFVWFWPFVVQRSNAPHALYSFTGRFVLSPIEL